VPVEDPEGVLTDEELPRRTAAGERGASDVLVTRHQPAVFRFARAATESRLHRARLRLAGHVSGCDVCERFGRRFAGVIRDLRESLGEPEPLEETVAVRLRARIAGL